MRLGLKFLGVALFAGLAFLIGLRLWNQTDDTALVDAFFDAVRSGDPQRLADLRSPDAGLRPDPGIVRAWMAALKDHLGAFQGIDHVDFLDAGPFQPPAPPPPPPWPGHRPGVPFRLPPSPTARHRSPYVSAMGTARFALGTARFQLVFKDGKWTRMALGSERLPNNWFETHVDATPCVDAGRGVIQDLLSGREERAYGSMDPSFRRDPAASQAKLNAAKRRLGDVRSVAPSGHAFVPGGRRRLVVHYEVTGTKATSAARLEFRFVGPEGWHARIAAFEFDAE